MVVLSEVDNVSNEVSPLFSHTLNSVLLNPRDFGVNEIIRLCIVAKYAFELFSVKEKTKWSKQICNIYLSDETRNYISTLNITVQKSSIVEHILTSVTIERLKELLHESESNEAEANIGDSGEPLFYIDSGNTKPASNKPKKENDSEEEEMEMNEESDEDVDLSEDDEPLEFFE